MRDELLARAQDAVQMALDSGASGAFASASRGRGVEYAMRDGTLEKVQENTSRAIALELYVEGRYSSHSTTDLRPDPLRTFVREAVAMTRLLQPDPHRALPDPALYADRPSVDLELVDSGLDGFDRDARLARLGTMGEQLRQTDALISWTAGVNSSHNIGAAVSSNGFEGVEESTSAWMGAELTLQDQGDARPEGWFWAGGRHLSDVPDPEQIAARCVADARSRLGSAKGPTRKTLMIVDPRASGRLVGALLGPASARSIQQGRSFWGDRLGKKAVSERLTLRDEPLRPRGLSSRLFDGEGISARSLPLVEGGVLRNVYVDTYYGRKAGMAPTTGSRSNLGWDYGKRDLAAILADADQAIYVTSWLGGNSDGTTGDFSLGLRGHLIKDGKIGAPIGEMNVTGGLLDLFRQLTEVGSDPYVYSSLYAPTLVFDGVQFSGA